MTTKVLNKYQEEAVNHMDGPCFVTSTPGSGKTTVLVERVVRLIGQGIPQKNILCLTFTNKAANEMKERICSSLNISNPDFFVGTFHSLCAKILRKIGEKGGYTSNFNIIDDREQIDMIQQIARQQEVEFKTEECYKVLNKVNYFRDQMEEEDWIDSAFTTDIELKIAKEYLNRCKRNNLIDFSGLIYETIKIIEQNEEIRTKIQNTFKYILVDEVQDTNKAQFYLVNLLGEKWKNIMLIGDVDQCIPTGEKVYTIDGYKEIENIKIGDEIYCLNRELGYFLNDNYTIGKVVKKYEKEVENYLTVEVCTFFAKEAIFSKDHMVFAQISKKQKREIEEKIGMMKNIEVDKEIYYFVPAQYLKEGMYIIAEKEGKIFYRDAILVITYKNYTGKLYDIDVEPHHNFISNGIVSHNSIYGWRGARYQNIQEFVNTHSDCRTICLSKNYRSTPQIISVIDKLICHNTTHAPIVFETDNPAGDPVRCRSFNDQVQEADWIGQMIKRFIDDGGWSPSDMAVLYRMNKMSEPIEQSLAQRNIPYDVIGSWSFYDRREVRDCLSMAKVLVNPRDGVSFHRSAKLLPGLGDVTIGKIENIAAEKGINLFEACQEMAKLSKGLNVRNSCKKLYDIYNSGLDFSDPAFCMNELIDKFNYKDYMEEKFQKDLVERQDCVQQLIDASGIYSGENGGLSEYLQKISLVTSNDKESGDDKVSLMSLHAVKGLEFKIVFLIGCELDILPHRMALMDDPFEGAEEERRVFFVGISRAQKLLYVTYCNNRKRFTKFGMKDIPTKPSPFLKECGLIK